MDIPRPENKRKTRIRRALLAGGGALALAAVTVGLSRLEPALTVNNQPLRIVGVAAEGFDGATALDAIAAQLAEERPGTNADVGIAAVALGERLVGGMRRTAMARRYWPGEDPLDAAVTLQLDGRSWTAAVVGVVADVRHALGEEPRPSVFVPYDQHRTGALHFTVRTAGEPAALVRAVQAEIWALNARMPFAAVTTLDGLLDGSLRERRFALLLVLAFAGTALVLAALGTYGLLAHESSRRTHETSVRMALGARRGRVLRDVVGQALRLASIGLALGAVVAAGAAQLLARFLFAVSALDPLTFAAVAGLLLAVAALASWLPARRAAGVDPVAALRWE